MEKYFLRSRLLRWLRRNQRKQISYGLNELDLKIARYLPKRNGVFVEAGANDGISQSNTLYFERNLGWHGLLVEPIPHLADECRKNRPGSTVENVALVPPSQSQSTIAMTYCDLMSVVKGAMKSDEEETEHIRKGCEVQGIDAYELEVRTATLSELLDKHRLHHIDLMSLDVEGYEAAVLEGIDLSRHRPKYFLIEARYRADVENILLPTYVPVDEFTSRDILYKCMET